MRWAPFDGMASCLPKRDIHLKGAMGPVPISKASLKAIGAPDDWADNSSSFLEALQSGVPGNISLHPLGEKPCPPGNHEGEFAPAGRRDPSFP